MKENIQFIGNKICINISCSYIRSPDIIEMTIIPSLIHKVNATN